MARLQTNDHPRYQDGLKYIYPVVSRRAGGVSVGVNLNPNDACNWRCVYCQVPGLKAGKGPAIDLERLEHELDAMLRDLLDGDFMETRVPAEARRFNDIAISGNGESTSSPDFADAIAVVGRVMDRFGLLDSDTATQSQWLREPLKVVLITNGSMVHKPDVQAGLKQLAKLNGEVWFKLDGASDAALLLINNSALGIERQLANLRTAASLCPTFIQTAAFRRSDAPTSPDGSPDAEAEVMAGTLDGYVDAVRALLDGGTPFSGVHLYSLARPSYQPEASVLIPLKRAELDPIAERLRALGLFVTVNE
jgi:hypothetical protein